MAWPKGKKRPGQRVPVRGPGRAKGQQNKITADLRHALMVSFDRVGGVEYLVKQASQNPSSYLSLLSRALPNHIKLDYEIPTDEQLALMTPLDMLKWAMRSCMQAAMSDPGKLALMVDAANKAAQYEHPKLASIEHKGSLSLDDLSLAQLGQLADALASRNAIEGSASEVVGTPEQGDDQGPVRDEPVRVH